MKTLKSTVVLSVLAAGAVALPGSALAATNPTATTGGATGITATSATLHGTVNPNHNATTYHFEYGKTKSYGSSTPSAQADASKGNQAVSQTVTSLQPSTTYHYRIVAVSSGFTALGGDRTFTTPAPPPNSVTLGANPGTPTFGHTTVLSGVLTGPQNAGVKITLQQQPFPYTAKFANLATTNTDNNGNYSFTITPSINTKYQVVANTHPQVTSPVLQVNDAYATSIKTRSKRIRGGKRVKFSGAVLPAHDGATVLIEKRGKHGIYRTVAKTVLKHSTNTSLSTYSKKIRIHRTGTFRVHVIGDATHSDGFSSSKRIRA